MATDDHYNLDNLKMHESMPFLDSDGGKWQVMRVPGGWIYTEYTAEAGYLFRTGGAISSSTFVPDARVRGWYD